APAGRGGRAVLRQHLAGLDLVLALRIFRGPGEEVAGRHRARALLALENELRAHAHEGHGGVGGSRRIGRAAAEDRVIAVLASDRVADVAALLEALVRLLP